MPGRPGMSCAFAVITAAIARRRTGILRWSGSFLCALCTPFSGRRHTLTLIDTRKTHDVQTTWPLSAARPPDGVGRSRGIMVAQWTSVRVRPGLCSGSGTTRDMM
ncbi:hypothetical protein K432DRAFT_50620 [Lepidopterella palustris CBS 459.81]|uniref:Uncharacterized protein n=1 Tax=Lepidopterella palustris CBS 459.81 TaxID=1314670 RepID=A0A8E2EAD0_9PEZI|nr:hypothetical protein K432DRAFT_50620 [Lepidopterella palustris CBS 459.81]